MSINVSAFRNIFATFLGEMDFFQIFLTTLAATETFPVLSNLSLQWLARYIKLSQFCFERDINRSMQHGLEYVRVLENLESPGILLWYFQGLESPGTRLLVLESSGKKAKLWNV